MYYDSTVQCISLATAGRAVELSELELQERTDRQLSRWRVNESVEVSNGWSEWLYSILSLWD